MTVSYKHIKLQTLKILMYTFVVQLLFTTQLFCQNIGEEVFIDSLDADSIAFVVDSVNLEIDSNKLNSPALPFDTVDINIKDDDIKSPVHYKALDSIVYDVENKMLYLYGNGEMKYDQTEVTAERVIFDWNTQMLSAEGVDSAGKSVGTPVMVQEGTAYEAKKMEYNFRTTKGKIYDVVTEEDGTFIHSEIVKKQPDNSWLSYKTKYTTCTDKEHPHFYIQARQAKVIPDKVMVSGPADLVISGINTPLALPFAIFPISAGRRSGLILPQYGTEAATGSFYLREGGYYWAANDYLSMGFTGEIWTNGTFGVNVATNYNVRYKSSGNVLLSYRRKMPNDPIKDKFDIQNDYSFSWDHRMDTKADPNNNFSANVNVESSSFNKNALIQNEDVLEVVNSSHINYIRRFDGKPYNLTLSANHSQSNSTHVFSVTLPEAAFNVSTITPFKSKISSTKKKFYEKIGFTYSARGKATATVTDTTFFTSDLFDAVQYGINQDLKVSASYKLFKYLSLTPSASYTEQWLFKEETIDFGQYYVQETDSTIDTLYTNSSYEDGFFARRNFNLSLRLGTELKGLYTVHKGKVKGFMHVMKPNLTYTYKPDFSNPIWNYYDTYSNTETNETVSYNKYSNTGVYGTVSEGETNALNFVLGNSLEMKVLNKKDTVNQFKKIPILKSLSFATGYNFAGDSISKFQDVTITASTSFLNNLFGLTGTLIYNPYSRDELNNKVSDTYMETHGKPLRFVSLNLNFDVNLRGKSKKKKNVFDNEYGTVEQREYVANNPELFYDFDIPWSFYASYHMSLTNGITGLNRDTTVLGLGSISFGGDLTLTPKWLISVTSGFDINAKDLTLTNLRLVRDLHCWEMALNWTAYPIASQNFTFELRVKSALLQDLKLTRKSVSSNYNSSF